MTTDYMEVKPINQDMYNRNMKSLEKKYPQYAAKIKTVEIYKKFNTFRTGATKTINLFNNQTNNFYYNVENPLLDAANSIKQLNLINVKLAVIMGLGLSYELDNFATNILPRNGTKGILIIEKEWEIFKIILHFLDFTEIINNKRVLLLIGEEHQDILPHFEKFVRGYGELLYYFKSIKFIYHETNFIWFKDYYMTMISTIRESLNYLLKFYGNDPADSLIGIENMMDNLDEIIYNPGINLLFNKFRGKPAVIVATGPSLNKNKHLLKGLEEKALFIAADASLKVMMQMGVKPHLVTALERQGRVDQLLAGFKKEEVDDIYFAGTPVIQKKVYDVFPAPRVIVYRNFDHFKWLGIDKGMLNIKQSSGNMAFKIADALGCDPIILIGQDLAYSRDGSTHAMGAVLGDKQTFKSGDLEVMGNDGEPIMTNRTWDNFRKAYEIDIRESKNTVINCTEGGALIRGTQIMTFQDAIDKYVKEDIHPLQIIRDHISVFSVEEAERSKEHLAKLFVKTNDDLKFMLSEALKGIKIISENKDFLESVLKGEISDEKRVTDLFNEMILIRKKIFDTQPTFQLYLMHVIQSYNIKFENDIHALFDQYQEKSEAYSAIMLENIKWFAIFHDVTDLTRKALYIGEDRLGMKGLLLENEESDEQEEGVTEE